jgi:hypothetical protein
VSTFCELRSTDSPLLPPPMKAPISQSGRTLRSMPMAPPTTVDVARKVASVASWVRWPPKLLAHTVIGAGLLQAESLAGALVKGPALLVSGA